jgi:hypothetical protein
LHHANRVPLRAAWECIEKTREIEQKMIRSGCAGTARLAGRAAEFAGFTGR